MPAPAAALCAPPTGVGWYLPASSTKTTAREGGAPGTGFKCEQDGEYRIEG